MDKAKQKVIAANYCITQSEGFYQEREADRICGRIVYTGWSNAVCAAGEGIHERKRGGGI